MYVDSFISENFIKLLVNQTMCYVAHHGTHKFAKNGHHIIRKEQTFRKPVCEETCTLCETLSFHHCGKNLIKSPGGNYVHKCPSRLGYNIKQKIITTVLNRTTIRPLPFKLPVYTTLFGCLIALVS